MSLYDEMFRAAGIGYIFSEQYTLGLMLRAEAALAKAQAEAGMFSREHAVAIEKRCRTTDILDIEKLKKDIPPGGNAAIPFVKQLTAAVRAKNPEAAKYVHLGATSQDIVDTATVLQIRAHARWMEDQLASLAAVLTQLTLRYAQTPMPGRTLLQHAKPITFGQKAAVWLGGVERSRARLSAVKNRALVAQLGGAAGNGNVYLTDAVRRRYAQILGLKPAASWHTQRDNLAEYAAVMGILTGSLGKIAKDTALLMQTEVGEAFEGAAPGKGGSSTMPHKRNPATCAAILANAHRVPFLVASFLSAMPQEHERSAGLWHSEWEVLTDIMQLAAGALGKSVELMESLEIDEARMRQNLELTNGLIYAENVSLALAAKKGKAAAHEWMEVACKKAVEEGRHLKDVLTDMGTSFSEQEWKNLFGL